MLKDLWDKATIQGFVALIVVVTVSAMGLMGRDVPEVLVTGFGAVITYLFVEAAVNRMMARLK